MFACDACPDARTEEGAEGFAAAPFFRQVVEWPQEQIST